MIKELKLIANEAGCSDFIVCLDYLLVIFQVSPNGKIKHRQTTEQYFIFPNSLDPAGILICLYPGLVASCRPEEGFPEVDFSSSILEIANPGWLLAC